MKRLWCFSLRMLFQPIVDLRGNAEEYYEVYIDLHEDDGSSINTSHLAKNLSGHDGESRFDRWLAFQAIQELGRHRTEGRRIKLMVSLTPCALLDKQLGDAR